MTANFDFSELLNWPERHPMTAADKALAHRLIREDIDIYAIDDAKPLVEELQQIRNDFADNFGDTPFIVTCWLRPLAWERHRGRSGMSQHTIGNAIDFVPMRFDRVHREWFADRLRDWDGGMKIYNTFIHIDLGRKRRW